MHFLYSAFCFAFFLSEWFKISSFHIRLWRLAPEKVLLSNLKKSISIMCARFFFQKFFFAFVFFPSILFFQQTIFTNTLYLFRHMIHIMYVWIEISRFKNLVLKTCIILSFFPSTIFFMIIFIRGEFCHLFKIMFYYDNCAQAQIS